MKKKGMYRKSQSTIEYMMTYGWALLIIIIALSIMWALGVFSSKPSTSGAGIAGPVNIGDILISPNGVSISARINPSYTGRITEIKVNTQTCSALGATLTSPDLTESPTTTTCLRASPPLFTKGNMVVGEITLTYTKIDGGTTHTLKGTFSGPVE